MWATLEGQSREKSQLTGNSWLMDWLHRSDVFNEHDMHTVVFWGRAPPSDCSPLGGHRAGGSEAGRRYGAETLESGLQTCGQKRLRRPGCRRDMMPLRRMKSSGAEATWLLPARSREGEAEGGRQVGRGG